MLHVIFPIYMYVFYLVVHVLTCTETDLLIEIYIEIRCTEYIKSLCRWSDVYTERERETELDKEIKRNRWAD